MCYKDLVLKREKKLQLERALNTLLYSCGACFQDIQNDTDDDIFDMVYVNDKLTCESPIETPYYVVFTDPLCYYCGNEHDVDTEIDGHYLICKDSGKPAKQKVTRVFVPGEERQ